MGRWSIGSGCYTRSADVIFGESYNLSIWGLLEKWSAGLECLDERCSCDATDWVAAGFGSFNFEHGLSGEVCGFACASLSGGVGIVMPATLG